MPRLPGLSRLVPSVLLVVVSAGLTAVATTSVPAAADPPADQFAPRYCSDPGITARPCLVSAFHNSVAVQADDPDFSVQLTGFGSDGFGGKEFQWLVQVQGSTSLSTSDDWVLVFDLGSRDTDTTATRIQDVDTDRFTTPSGDHRLRVSGRPVVLTQGCNQDVNPTTCPSKPTGESVVLEGTVRDLAPGTEIPEFVGYDVAQSPLEVNDIQLETAPDGTRYLYSGMANTHYRADGTTVFKGRVHFRLPYAFLRADFEIPDPDTLAPGSLVGQVNGTPATFTFTQDPEGGAVLVDVDGITFSRRELRVAVGTIVPTRPKLTSATRPGAHRAVLRVAASTARGARPTGYRARCVSGKLVATRLVKPAVRARGITVTGLQQGRRYSCRVTATSKAGPSPASYARRV